MALIDLDKFIASMIEAFPAFKEEGRIPCMYKEALEKQGLEYKDGKIVRIPHDVEPEFDDEYIQEWLISSLEDGTMLLPYEPRFKRAIEWVKQQKSK